jgi:pyruvate dehydrogenase E2 component (dihydrolipoamide acetyltransferase)
MATNVILPALGMAQETGKILQWLKKPGDAVKQGESIAEIETDKVTVELEAPATGTLSGVSAAVGEDVPVGQVIAVILAAGEAPLPPNGEHVGARFIAPVVATPTQPPSAQTDGAHADGIGHTRQASPKAKRIAAERGLDIATLRGTGPNGVVLAADVLAAPMTKNGANGRDESRPYAVSAAPSAAGEGGQPLSTAWRVMAERTTQSWTTTPHFFLMREVRADAFKAWHAQAQKRATEKLTLTDLLVKIVATALREHPRLNASWQQGTIVTNPEINVGLAVAVADGLLVPVIPQADDLSLNGIARHRKDLVERAQAGKLRPADLQGGTFTISNLGMYGIDVFNAIINAPQAAILAVGAVVDRVVPLNGQPVVLPMMTLSLSCDHRVVDGARGAQFLATVADLIRDPSGL